MKLSTKGRHAITAMMELALRDSKGPVTLADISVEQSISVSYLEQLFARLAQPRSGHRHAWPGWWLLPDAARQPKLRLRKFSARWTTPCRHGANVFPVKNGHRASSCGIKLSARIYDYLNGLTLAEAVNQNSESSRDEAEEPRFGFRLSAVGGLTPAKRLQGN